MDLTTSNYELTSSDVQQLNALLAQQESSPNAISLSPSPPAPFPWGSFAAGAGVGLAFSACAYGAYRLLDRRLARRREKAISAAQPAPTPAQGAAQQAA